MRELTEKLILNSPNSVRTNLRNLGYTSDGTVDNVLGILGGIQFGSDQEAAQFAATVFNFNLEHKGAFYHELKALMKPNQYSFIYESWLNFFKTKKRNGSEEINNNHIEKSEESTTRQVRYIRSAVTGFAILGVIFFFFLTTKLLQKIIQ